MSNSATTATAPSTPTSQRNRDSAQTERVEQHVDEIMAAISKPTSTETIAALVVQHGLQFEEWDTDFLDEQYRDKFFALYVETADRKVIVVPSGQDPDHRLAAVRALLNHLAVTA
ncbi:hypothetical protein ABZZ80_24115 [Streptomyces sp. NPDC006356]